jgi:hypothetical protein
MADSEPHKSSSQVTATSSAGLPTTEAELPVVARLIVEIRSDGSRTVARGAMEDAASGARATIEASGTTPLELALKLAKNIVSAPWLARTIGRGALRGLLRKP